MAIVNSQKSYSAVEARSILSDYEKRSADELSRLFRESEAPALEELIGETTGTIVLCPGCPRFSRFLATIFFDSPISRWSGKVFVGSPGEAEMHRVINLYDNRIGRSRYPMRVRLDKATCDSRPCVRLDFAFPLSVFGAHDEFRRIKEGVFLGQTYQRLPFWNESRLLAHFVLCAVSVIPGRVR